MTFLDYMPRKIFDGKVYDPSECQLIQRIERGDADLYLFMKNTGELFVVEHTDRVFYATKSLMMRKFIRLFDASLIPERALNFQGWNE